ncbi:MULTISPECIES: barstar family protein [unclassified Pseudomonas]|uniref:barstar family protein n=1 Tax=unclassified Pseudomonas TaxID=196821 RepID=UPI0011EE6610|nr:MULTISPECIES: barstar family protein [unclassified Pseudomonas]KAA0946941.1 ribonuclease inhibitor [Pseudomonas sp. ANT_H4]KAA0953483.1 ribonuclease inhibitor [Pseudomonas sp. ANT_H14]
MTRLPVIKIDLSSIKDSQELHSTLSNVLGFPDWYGQNWDAFWDAITGLVEMPITLQLSGWDIFSEHLPQDARLLQQCLTDMTLNYPDLAPEVHYMSTSNILPPTHQ